MRSKIFKLDFLVWVCIFLFLMNGKLLAQANIAKGKPAWQSSTKDKSEARNGAALMVDGNPETFNCTDWEDAGWLQVDLKGNFELTSLTIETNEFGQPSPFEQFVVFLSNYEIPLKDFSKVDESKIKASSVFFIESKSERKGVYTLDLGKNIARWVRIQTKKGGQPIRVRELSILGTSSTATPPTTRKWDANLSEGKQVQLSSVEKPQHSGEKSIDNDKNTFALTNNEALPWLQIDLGNRYNITELNLFSKWDDKLADIVLIFSDNPFSDIPLDYDEKTLERFAVKAIRVTEKKTTFNIPIPNIVARYVRVQRKGTLPSNSLEVGNLEVVGDDVPSNSPIPPKETWWINLAKGKQARQSSTRGENQAANAIDSNPQTVAATEWFKGIPWWELDLGQVFDIQELTMFSNFPDRLGNFYLIFSENPFPNESLEYNLNILEKYAVKVVQQSTTTQSFQIFNYPKAIPARYVRVQRALEGGDGLLEITDLKVIGNPSLSKAAPTGKPKWDALLAEGKPFFLAKDGYAMPAEQIGQHQEVIGNFQKNTLTLCYKDVSLKKTRLIQYNFDGSNFSKKWKKDVPNGLEFLGGFTTDGENFYVLSTINEWMAEKEDDEYRDNIFNLHKVNFDGKEIWTKDLNKPAYNPDKVYTPMTAGTASIVFGNKQIGIISSTNTAFDKGIKRRHQAAFRLAVDAETGTVTTKANWMLFTHSINQRAIFDGKDFVFSNLGDVGVMPGAGITLHKISTLTNTQVGASYMGIDRYVYVKNGEGFFTFMNMSDIRPAKNGYVVGFSSTIDGSIYNDAGVFNVGMVHVVKDFEKVTRNALEKEIIITDSINDSRKFNPKATGNERFNSWSNGKPMQNTGIVWLTNYTDAFALRLKVYASNENKFMFVWEKWTSVKENGKIKSQNNGYVSTFAAITDEYGNILKPATDIGKVRLPHRDELFNINGKASFVTGNPPALQFKLTQIDENLRVTEVNLDY